MKRKTIYFLAGSIIITGFIGWAYYEQNLNDIDTHQHGLGVKDMSCNDETMSAQTLPEFHRLLEDREALGDVVLHPGGKLGRGLAILLDGFIETCISLGAVRTVEDGTEVGANLQAHGEVRHV